MKVTLSVITATIILLGTFVLSNSVKAKNVTVTSPNGKLKVVISDDNQQPSYQVYFNEEALITRSRLGFVYKQQPAFDKGFSISRHESTKHHSTWQQPWGERTEVVDHHQKLTVEFTNKTLNDAQYSVEVKVFNDGLGFRYLVPKQKNYEHVEIVKELTEFTLSNAENTTAYWIPARGWNRYEYIYNQTPVFEASHLHTPATFKTENNIHISIHEAALVDYAGMTLKQGRPGKYHADLTPWFDGVAVKTQTDFKSPWRTIQVADNATDLLNSDLILNLNEPNKLGDVSWVNPGKYIGIWWEMHINVASWGTTDPKVPHGATTENTKRYIDFAAKYGFDGVLVEGWNIGWDGEWYFNGDVFSFTKNYPDFDINELAKYAKNKDVKLVGHHETSGNVTNYRNQMDDAFKLYSQLGIEQVKTGYVADGGDIKRIDENGVVRK